jgi:predicted metal-dependent phosphoesterase TrpH
VGKADLHIHTTAGDGLDSVEAILDHVEHATQLDVVAITEHDNLLVGLEAREVAAKRGLRTRVVPGAEITTLNGHLVALYIERPVPIFRPIEETIEAIRAQGGLCFVPHPLSWLTRSVGPRTLARLMARRHECLAPDGLELANCSPTTRTFMAKARRLNAALYGLPSIGASDAHFKEAAGSAYTEFAGETEEDLKRALQNGDVFGVETGFPSLREVGVLRALSVPILGLRATPRRLGWRRTALSFVGRFGS